LHVIVRFGLSDALEMGRDKATSVMIASKSDSYCETAEKKWLKEQDSDFYGHAIEIAPLYGKYLSLNGYRVSKQCTYHRNDVTLLISIIL
jgi:hypothetical protein